MSNITRIHVQYTDGAPLATDDPRAAMARSVQAARAVIAEITPTDAQRPTPCAEWDVHRLAQHIVGVVDRAAAAPTGVSVDELPEFAEVPVEALGETFDASVRTMHERWSSREAMETTIEVSWGTYPGAQFIGIFAAEILVHAWDLSVAIGVELDWPDDDARVHFEMSRIGIPESPRDEFMPFDPVFRPGAEAPAIEHLVGWQGRDVDRWRVTG